MFQDVKLNWMALHTSALKTPTALEGLAVMFDISEPVKPVKQAQAVAAGPQGNPLRILIPLLLLAAWAYYNFLR
ncbi:hypothetical protein G6F55_003399 [Rhizopus delemar]|nr:hypothetical protein G6F55_003399 [Rhizopus delemar]KAG1502224.1 hypothetical protein G6F54_002502 [Rhizopus delemar]